MEQHEFDELDKRAWKELGFYYEYNDEKREWHIYGDRMGLEKFGRAITAYCISPKNVVVSEHIHLGPYQYLKIVTWDEPRICDQGLFGSLEDLSRFTHIFETKLGLAKANDVFVIGEEYSETNTADLLVHVMETGFDPSSMDNATWIKPDDQIN